MQLPLQQFELSTHVAPPGTQHVPDGPHWLALPKQQSTFDAQVAPIPPLQHLLKTQLPPQQLESVEHDWPLAVQAPPPLPHVPPEHERPEQQSPSVEHKPPLLEQVGPVLPVEPVEAGPPHAPWRHAAQPQQSSLAVHGWPPPAHAHCAPLQTPLQQSEPD